LRKEPEKYFEEILKTTDFLLEDRANDGRDVQQSIFADSFGGLNQPKQSKPADITVTVACTLEEFYNGSIKQVEYMREVVQHDAKTKRLESCVQQIEVKPGFSESSELVFKKMGHQAAGHIHADLIVKFTQVDHACYRRVGHDLILTHKMSLQAAFEGTPCSFRTLDGRALTIAIDEQICPQTCKLVEDEGMPVEKSETRGNLYLRFDIQFPSAFQLETKQRVIAAL
jgi:DnaJ-class molecular chaperone